MKDLKTLQNVILALGFFVLWGNIVSLLLPAEQYGAVIKMIDFASLLFILAVLVPLVIGRHKGGKDRHRAGVYVGHP